MPLDGTNYVQQDSEVVTVLKKARELVQTPCKWSYGKGGWFDNTYCVGRAILAAQGVYEWSAAADERAMRVFAGAVGARVYSRPHGSIAKWNDAAGRTHEEILDGFDKAIILAGGTP